MKIISFFVTFNVSFCLSRNLERGDYSNLTEGGHQIILFFIK